MSLLDEHLDILRSQGFNAESHRDGPCTLVVLRKYPLPRGRYLVNTTDLLIQVPEPYNLGAIDMFWTECKVLLPDYKVPRRAEVTRAFLDRLWRRFSWHTETKWNPDEHNLLTHLSLVDDRLLRGE